MLGIWQKKRDTEITAMPERLTAEVDSQSDGHRRGGDSFNTRRIGREFR